jgi:DNA-binding transcriptional LysR family regulator
VGTITFAAFGAPSLLRGKSRPRLRDLPWIGFEEALLGIAQERWLREHPPQQPPRTRWGSLISLIHAAAAGLGVAALTCLAAARHRELVRLSPVLGEIPLYLLKHPDVRGNARVVALTRHIVDEAPAWIARLSPSSRTRILRD